MAPQDDGDLNGQISNRMGGTGVGFPSGARYTFDQTDTDHFQVSADQRFFRENLTSRLRLTRASGQGPDDLW